MRGLVSKSECIFWGVFFTVISSLSAPELHAGLWDLVELQLMVTRKLSGRRSEGSVSLTAHNRSNRARLTLTQNEIASVDWWLHCERCMRLLVRFGFPKTNSSSGNTLFGLKQTDCGCIYMKNRWKLLQFKTSSVEKSLTLNPHLDFTQHNTSYTDYFSHIWRRKIQYFVCPIFHLAQLNVLLKPAPSLPPTRRKWTFPVMI